MAGNDSGNGPEREAVRRFGQLLAWHIERGTRPDGQPQIEGVRWTNQLFADAVRTNERSVRDWRNGKYPPKDLRPIERELFGDNPLYAGYRNALRRAYRLARGEDGAELAGDDAVPGEGARPAPDNVPTPTAVSVPTPAKPIDLPYPPLGSLFKGRNDFMRQLHQSLTRGAGRSAIVSSALYGLGGVGKTRAAVEYAWAHEKDYTALLFVIAETPEALRRNLAALTGPLVLNLPEHGADKEDIRIKAALDWLKAHPGWFLILDNLDTPEALAEADRLMGRLSGGHVLVTSRLANFAGNFETLALDVLSAEDAAAFLLERTEGRRRTTDDDAAEARSLAIELGQLALALEQAGAYIARLAISFARYRQSWHENWPKVAGWTDEKITKYPRSVAVTWQTSVDQVGDPARRLLERLAWFAPEPVPDFMLDVPLPGVAAEDLDEALADLSSYSLVRRHPGRQEFSVHRLVQDVTRRSLGGEAAHAALTDALTWLDDGFSADDGDLAVRADMERLASHVRFAVERGDDCGISIPTAALAARLADLLQDRVPLHDIEPLYRRAFAIFDRLAKADPENPGWQRELYSALWFLADVEIQQGNLALAFEKLNTGREIMDRLAQSDPGNAGWQRDLSVSYERVGDVLVAQGNLPEALKAFRDSLAIADRLAKADPGNAGWQRDLGISNERIGNVLMAQGNLPEAMNSYQATAGNHLPARQGRPRKRRMAARPVGIIQQGRRRAGGPGQSARGAQSVPRLPRHQRPARQGRPRKRRMAIRPRDQQRTHR